MDQEKWKEDEQGVGVLDSNLNEEVNINLTNKPQTFFIQKNKNKCRAYNQQTITTSSCVTWRSTIYSQQPMTTYAWIMYDL